MQKKEMEGVHLDLKYLNHIKGWLSFHDYMVFAKLLGSSSLSTKTGDLLEIGVYEGKSAILLGSFLKENEELHVCDIFENSNLDTFNLAENMSSYPGLAKDTFTRNFLEALGFLPTIHAIDSKNLASELAEKRFRFIHIDGSHIYEYAANDLEIAIGHLQIEGGIIAIDDFRAPHTPGVALAVWERVSSGEIFPVVMTPAKIYVMAKPSDFRVEVLKKELELAGIECLIDDFCGHKVLRTVGSADSELYQTNQYLRFIPPFLVPKIRAVYKLFMK